MKKHKNGARERLLKSEGFKLKIGADADGMPAFMEAHEQHIQKGPDVLIFSAPDHSLSFKTRFEPGPEPGRLSCNIAGELTTIKGMDFMPEDWRAFADKLTTRNARIVEKSATETYIEKTLQEQRAASEKVRLEYEKSGDLQIIIGFIKKSKTGAALQEPWINAKIQEWKRTDRRDLLKAAFQTGRGENKEPGKRAIEGLMFVDRIDKHRRGGKSLNEAFISEAERTGGGNLTGDDLDRELTALKNKYHRAKRIKTEVTIQGTAEAFAMTAFPAKVTQGNFAMFGTWTITFPKK